MAFGKKKPTAEQKLLQMIEASQGGSALSSKATQKISKKQNVLALLKIANVVLGFAIVAVGIFLFVEIGSGVQMASKEIKFKTPKEQGMKAAAEVVMGEPQSLAFYINTLETRNIFQPF